MKMYNQDTNMCIIFQIICPMSEDNCENEIGTELTQIAKLGSNADGDTSCLNQKKGLSGKTVCCRFIFVKSTGLVIL